MYFTIASLGTLGEKRNPKHQYPQHSVINKGVLQHKKNVSTPGIVVIY